MKKNAISAFLNRFSIALFFFTTVLLLIIFRAREVFSYCIFILASIFLITRWLFSWKIIYAAEMNPPQDHSAGYDILFKRLAKYLLLICLLYITFSVFEYYRSINTYYLGEVTFSSDLEKSGFTSESMALQFQEIKEEIQQSQEHESTKSERMPMQSDYLKESRDNSKDFQVQGFSFPLSKIGYSIGEGLWGKRKLINLAVTSDSTSFKGWVQITGSAVQTFEEYYESGFEKQMALVNMFRNIEYFVLEKTDPYLMAVQYMSNDPGKALEVLPEEETTRWGQISLGITKARVFSVMGDTAKAETTLRAFIKDQPGSAGLLVDLVALKSGLKQSDSVLFFLKKASRLDRKNGLVYENLGNYYYYDRHDPDSAIYFFAKCLKYKKSLTNADIIDAYFRLADCYRLISKLDEAEDYFTQACNYDPESYYRLINGYTQIEEHSLEKMIREQKDFVPAMLLYCFKNIDLLLTGDACCKLLENCLNKNRQIIPAKILLAGYYYSKKDFEKADSLINDVILIQPDNYIAYYARSLGYFNTDKANAEWNVRRSLKINPFNTDALQLLCNILYVKGDKPGYVSSLQRLLWFNPYNAYANCSMGDVYFDIKDWQKCEHYYMQAIAAGMANVDTTQLYFNLAQSAFTLQNYETAKQYYDSCRHYRLPSGFRRVVQQNLEVCNDYTR